jgi:Sjogren's syndrome/scleroderma autoantigen 1 (Autoantigen p27)
VTTESFTRKEQDNKYFCLSTTGRLEGGDMVFDTDTQQSRGSLPTIESQQNSSILENGSQGCNNYHGDRDQHSFLSSRFGTYEDDDETMLSLDVERIERLLSHRLLEGYCLLEKACPACSVPLIKRPVILGTTTIRSFENAEWTTPRIDETGSNLPTPHANELSQTSIDVRSHDTLESSYTQPIAPIPGVPFCVYCEAHVVTDDKEVSFLEDAASTIAKKKGHIFVGASETKKTITDMLEASRQQRKDGGVLESVGEGRGLPDVTALTAKDPTPRHNGNSCFGEIQGYDDGSSLFNFSNKSYSLSPRMRRNKPRTPGRLSDNHYTPRSLSYSPKMKRTTSVVPKFFASFDEMTRASYDEDNTNENLSYTTSPSINGRTRTRFDVDEIGSVTEKKSVSFVQTEKLSRNSKLEPPSPMIVVLTHEQILQQKQKQEQQLQLQERNTKQLLDPTPQHKLQMEPHRKRFDPEPTVSREDTDIDPIIVISSNEAFSNSRKFQKEAPSQHHQQQTRNYTQQQHFVTVPSVEIHDGNNFDEVSTLAYTYDEGSITNDRSSPRRQGNMNQQKNTPVNTFQNKSSIGMAENEVLIDSPLPDYETR